MPINLPASNVWVKVRHPIVLTVALRTDRSSLPHYAAEESSYTSLGHDNSGTERAKADIALATSADAGSEPEMARSCSLLSVPSPFFH